MKKPLRFKADVLSEKATAAGDVTMYDIAVRTGVRESTISRILSGRSTPTLATLAAVAVAYGTTLDELVDGMARPPAVPAQRGAAA
ncbi:helix-turn-helix transcriptional regulator [Streptomyces sp. NE06-03C]|uniref:helix-turn-helix domain-containing protein n=1 Tax=Streptomyces sp. NE06-03C TaxID=3028694 RepID=UPI0029A550E6|nr:helix-turn-helix transcriptional regulator [Streptomyces sp. NE06-03C]MDX2919697.1 helix-turn-helix transcriptional regulator [Streptomyces sp. NE06-03C]